MEQWPQGVVRVALIERTDDVGREVDGDVSRRPPPQHLGSLRSTAIRGAVARPPEPAGRAVAQEGLEHGNQSARSRDHGPAVGGAPNGQREAAGGDNEVGLLYSQR